MPMPIAKLALLGLVLVSIPSSAPVFAQDFGEVERFDVLEIEFEGPELTARDAPSRDIELAVSFAQAGYSFRVQGFWDGDGKGGARGSVFKVRVCPPRAGVWRITDTLSNHPKLAGARVGQTLQCVRSARSGHWVRHGRWYRRSDGTRPFIVGNTQYTFLSRRDHEGKIVCDPVEDIRANARFYKKLRFSLCGGRYVDRDLKPFLDDEGRPTDHGRFSYRPNPRWFHERVDPVIAAGHDVDLICDLILCGPDAEASRSTLLGDARPWLRYVAARYGSYPCVWFCLANEFGIKRPKYSAGEIVERGETLGSFLGGPTPISVHGDRGDWEPALNGRWHDHVIVQHKIKSLGDAADTIARNHTATGKPVLNDENAYLGDGDRFSLDDVMEGCLGTFLGGGYPTTGEKYASKLGQYFWGGFDARKHTASERLFLLRDYVDRHVDLSGMTPLPMTLKRFISLPRSYRVLGRAGLEFVIGSNAAHGPVSFELPEGVWRVVQVDLMSQRSRTVARRAQGAVALRFPDSRAALTHLRRVGDEEKRRVADLLLHGGKIVTVDDQSRIVEAIAIEGEKILAVGSNEDVAKHRGPDTRVVDLEGQCVIPGLIDSHVHAGGASMHELDHTIPAMETIAAVLDYIRSRARALEKGSWIRVRQVFITRLRERRYPTREELDEAAPDHPVIFSTGPDASLNSRALTLSGIDKSFEVDDDGPGHAEKDPRSGELTGILRSCTRYVKFVDPARRVTEDDRLERLHDLIRDYNSVGITSVADRNASPSEIERFRKLRERGELTTRVFLSHSIGTIGTVEDVVARIEKVAEHPLFGDDPLLRIGGVKVFLDGGMLTGSAYMREPWGVSEIYSIDDPKYRGVLFIPKERLVRFADAAIAKGLQFTAHSVGDGAVHTLLEAYEEVSRKRPIRAVRPCITHSNFMSREAVELLPKLGVVADIQPAWLWLDTNTLSKQFSYERLRYFQPLSTIFAVGGIAGGGSDHMQKIGSLRAVNPYNPFLGMWIAMTRRARWHEGRLHPEEALDREQALRFYTINNAHLLRQEERTGSLEPGKLADLVILDRDLLACPIDAVRDARVLETYMGGRRVFAAQ